MLLLLVYTGGQFLLVSFTCYPTGKPATYLHTVQYLKLVNSCVAWLISVADGSTGNLHDTTSVMSV